MATQDRPIHQDQHSGARYVYGVLLVLAVMAVLAVAARLAFPSGLGIHREPSETAPVEEPVSR